MLIMHPFFTKIIIILNQEPDADDKLNGGAPVSLDWATANEVDDFLEDRINGQKVSPSPNLIEFSSHVEIPSHHVS